MITAIATRLSVGFFFLLSFGVSGSAFICSVLAPLSLGGGTLGSRGTRRPAFCGEPQLGQKLASAFTSDPQISQ